MEVLELIKQPHREKQQPKTKAMIEDLQDSVEFGTVEPKIQNGKITHIVVTQIIKAID